jgi:signal transduction histidine kinase
MGSVLSAQREPLEGSEPALLSRRSLKGLIHAGRGGLQRFQSSLSVLTKRLATGEDLGDLPERLQLAQDDLRRLFDSLQNYLAAVELEKSKVDYVSIWREAWQSLPATSRGQLDEKFDSEAEHTGFGDAVKLRDCFRSLFENSLEAGASLVSVVLHDNTKANIIELTICDNGPGFGPHQTERVFEPFFTTKARSAGLGLAICRRILEAHGGSIALANTAWAEFRIRLPRTQL